MFSHLVDGQHTVQQQLCFGVCKLREDQTGAIAEDNGGIGQVDGLDVLGFAWSGRDAHFFAAEEGVDGAGFTDVRVSDQTDGRLISLSCTECDFETAGFILLSKRTHSVVAAPPLGRGLQALRRVKCALAGLAPA